MMTISRTNVELKRNTTRRYQERLKHYQSYQCGIETLSYS